MINDKNFSTLDAASTRHRPFSLALHGNIPKSWRILLLSACVVGLLADDTTASKTLKATLREDVQLPAQNPVEQPGIIGIELEVHPQSCPVILRVFPETPSMKAGLQREDEIIAINMVSTEGLSAQEVDKAISDIPGTRIHFLIRRYGKLFPVIVTVMAATGL